MWEVPSDVVTFFLNEKKVDVCSYSLALVITIISLCVVLWAVVLCVRTYHRPQVYIYMCICVRSLSVLHTNQTHKNTSKVVKSNEQQTLGCWCVCASVSVSCVNHISSLFVVSFADNTSDMHKLWFFEASVSLLSLSKRYMFALLFFILLLRFVWFSRSLFTASISVK